MGIILSKPVELGKVLIVVQKDYVDDVTRSLREVEAVHVERLSEKAEELSPLYDRVNGILERIQKVMEFAKGESVEVNVTLLDYESFNLDAVERYVNEVYCEVEGLLKKRDSYVRLIERLEEAKKVLPNLPGGSELGYLSYPGRFFSLITVYGKVENFNSFLEQGRDVSVVYRRIVDENVFAIVGSTKINLTNLAELAKNVGLKVFSNEALVERYGAKAKVYDVAKLVEEDYVKLSNEAKSIDDEVKSIVKRSLRDLAKQRVILENNYNELLTIGGFLKSKHLCVIKSWIPKDRVNEVSERLRKNGLTVFMDVKNPVKGVDNPPTLMKNRRVLEWFEPIVKFIGVPNYWEWDPTPIFAYSFSLFFGLMLGDVGYAAALILASLLVLDKLVKEPFNRDYVFFKKSIVFSSLIGLLVGCIFGSVFGVTIHSLLGDPTKPEFLQGFLAVVLLIGLVHINIGHVLSLIKATRNRSWGDVMSETGLFIAEAFGIPLVLYRFLGIDVLNVNADLYGKLLYPVFVGLTLIVAGSIKTYGGLGGILWIFNVTGLLGDVLSYSRLAGVGLATFFLAQSFNQLAVMVYTGLSASMQIAGFVLGSLLALVILVFGHFLNTVLSAIGCFVHSLRLCFIEFLTKFYEGSGYLFEPLRIVTRRRIVVE